MKIGQLFQELHPTRLIPSLTLGILNITLSTSFAVLIFWRVGIYLEQQTTAAVIMQQPRTLYRLSNEALQRMKVIRLHEFMVYVLSERLVHTTKTLSILLDEIARYAL